ncbi:tannase/feruloyl esterase family alpha/beta hydrolase [Mangrovibacter plantisponsor]|uniref:Feruloyl esterase n=1 Tax=Mangrovibacter plantisponsor TaxID=451513 RepID=A0A317PU11_9ENTR|nr:tannase/feruloyl esterase family alpha/beta hydrolase [Mangrovibacter plantisponsor]PWW05400.1 feruloyl esterase [Mangrovibacter plantisponsor]
MRMLIALAWAGMMALFISPVFAQPVSVHSGIATVPSAQACEALMQVDLTGIGGKGSVVSSAKEETINAVNYCVVSSKLMPSITIKTLLPVTTWNGRYMQLGCGGLCGNIMMDVGAAAGCAPLAQGGFALAATDMGHSMEEVDFGNSQQKREDFAWRAQHLAVVTSKSLIQHYYAQAAKWSYFNGCSDGGREALMEAQRFPRDFNGIIAGAAAMNFQVQNALYHSWMAVSNTDKEGKAIITADRLPLIHNAVLNACDALDGQKDGLLSDPMTCHFNPAVLQCPPGSDTPQANCLSSKEVEAVKRFYSGPVDPKTGQKLVVGSVLPGSELAWAGVFVPQTADGPIMSRSIALASLRYMNFVKNPGASFTLKDMTFDANMFDKLRALHSLYDATNPNLAAFKQAGGKLIIWHGLADPHISPINSIAFHQAVGRAMGVTQRDAFERLYLLPGVYHCSGGEGPSLVDFLTPMMNWVEHGVAPEAVMAWQAPAKAENSFGQPQGAGAGKTKPAAMMPPVQDGKTRFRLQSIPAGAASRPVYPFPLMAVYSGQGERTNGSSYKPVKRQVLPFYTDWRGADFYQPHQGK